MPKKTSRAARTTQSQRIVREPERKMAESARPLVVTASDLRDKTVELGEESQNTALEQKSARPAVNPQTYQAYSSGTATRTAPVVRAVSRRFTGVKQPALSRQDEYNFVRSDLRTVLILTILMIIVLIILTIAIGR